jgi:3-phosphoshikimate 1-carboxyvinyltransferase
MQAAGAAALGSEASRLENLPDTPGFRAFRASLEALGATFVPTPDGQWSVSGSGLRVPERPLRPEGDLGALILAGLQSGSGVDFEPGSGDAVSSDVRGLLQAMYPAEESGKTALHRKARILCKPFESGWKDGLAKIPALFHHLAAAEGLELHLQRPGCDLPENVLRHFGVDLKIERDDAKDADELTRRIARQMRAAGKQEPVTRLRLPSGARVRGAALSLPGDVGEAAVAALAATLIPGSDVLLENVLLNPGRAGFFSALRRMGADLEVVQRRERAGEAFGTLRVRSSGLFGKRFDAESLADMREEVFLLLVAAAFAEGESVFRDLDFLRGGEPDRLKSLVAALKQAGVDMGELEDGLVLRGKGEMDGGTYDALGHPGLAAAYAVLALKSHGASTLRGAQGLEWRYPGLLAKLEAAAEKPGAEKPA